jgi:hypothetical protein
MAGKGAEEQEGENEGVAGALTKAQSETSGRNSSGTINELQSPLQRGRHEVTTKITTALKRKDRPSSKAYIIMPDKPTSSNIIYTPPNTPLPQNTTTPRPNSVI